MLEQTAIHSFSNRELNMDEPIPCVSPTSFWAPQHIVESAWLEHAPFAFWLMEVVRPAVFVELGTHAGFSFLAFCQAAQRLRLPTACYAIDTWEGDDHAGFYGEQIFAALSGIQGRHYSAFSRLMRARFDEALVHFTDGEIDLLHIDGRHGYDDVVEDYTSWLPKVSGHGVVLFHDINVRDRDFGVWRLWEELRDKHPSFEFIHGHGLGVLCPGSSVPPGLRPLVESSGPDRVSIREAYSRLGAAVSTQYVLERTHADLTAQIGALRQQLDAHSQDEERLRAQLQGETGNTSHLREDIVAREQTIAQLRAELQNEADQLASLREVIADRDQTIEKLRSELQDGAQPFARLNEDFMARERTISQLRRELALARRGLDSMRSELADLSNVRETLAGAQRDLAAAQTSLALANNELGLIRASTTWRALSVVRAVGSRLPVPVRRQFRRGAKALWWAVTPHRMPARIRFLRTRASQQAVLDGTRGDQPRAYISYQPPEKSGNARADDMPRGRYRLDTGPSGYVFVPRRRPDNFDRQVGELTRRPTFSIVVPLYNTADDLFSRMAGSVLAQWYPYWELILVDDKSPLQSVRDNALKLSDSRVKTVLLERNQGISGATNRGLAEATGDYIVFLDHDDELTDDCLFELAKCIDAEDPDYVYSDEDKILPDGSFGQPFFKPDWSPDTLMSTMYTCHVSCVRRSLLESVGDLRSEFDGSQDWDFVLRVTEAATRISHVPKVLYHWRVIPQSVASDLNAKPYAIDAARRARVAALERRGLKGTVEAVPQLPGYFRVKYDVKGTPLVSIIIPSKNNGAVLKRCLDTILQRSQYQNLEIVLLDNGSTDEATVNYLASLHVEPKIRIVRHDAPFNYSEINNIGAREAKGSILLFLNDDTEVISPDWIERMAGYAQLKHIGAVGAKLLYPDSRKVQHSGVVNLSDGPNHAFLFADADAPGYFVRNLIEYDWIAVTGACLMVEREKFDAVGGFDECFPLAYNDVDLCFRLVGSGLFNVVCPSAQLLHYESLSRGLDSASEEKRLRLEQEKRRLYLKHPQFLMRDPFHNPNLAPNDLYFALA